MSVKTGLPLMDFIDACYRLRDMRAESAESSEMLEMTFPADWHLSGGILAHCHVYDAIEALDGDVHFDLVVANVCDCPNRSPLTLSDRFCTKCINSVLSYDFNQDTLVYLQKVSDPTNWAGMQ